MTYIDDKEFFTSKQLPCLLLEHVVSTAGNMTFPFEKSVRSCLYTYPEKGCRNYVSNCFGFHIFLQREFIIHPRNAYL